MHLIEDGENSLTVKELLSNKIFWLMIFLMICDEASEQSVSQWASTFAEKTLNGNKSLGDLAGPMFFAIMIGISRTVYGKLGEKINLKLSMIFCSLLCFISYIIISLSPWALLSLICCGICGFSVGILWPGTFSISSSILKKGGTALFAFLALAGDIGCSLGPTIVGRLSSIFNDNIKIGILFSSIFPILLIIGIILSGINKKLNLIIYKNKGEAFVLLPYFY
ncbi:MFS transporter [Clostridium tertium]|uniref:MFS transporter n=1 Tax=Clostridium tertium TaxID=1559 RepID=UPI00311951E6